MATVGGQGRFSPVSTAPPRAAHVLAATRGNLISFAPAGTLFTHQRAAGIVALHLQFDNPEDSYSRLRVMGYGTAVRREAHGSWKTS